jgi:hypothetical protein
MPEIVFILINEKGELVDVFYKRSNAEDSIPPEYSQKLQVKNNLWRYRHFGSNDRFWTVMEKRPVDVKGLAV